MSTNTEYNEWMNQKQSEVKITVSPSSIEHKMIMAEYQAQTGSDNYYDNREVYDEIYNRFRKEIILENVSLNEAQAFAEPIRIANPDQCVSLYTSKNSFIGNTTWNDQLQWFIEYPTYTEVGKHIMAKRKAEANAQGVMASWE
jgi:type IV secretory pathway component VirB8